MAKLSWACPECDPAAEPKPGEGICPAHLVALEPVSPDKLVLDTPWERIALPIGTDVVVGRDSMGPQDAARFDHVGRRHLLVTAHPEAGTATVIDLQSTNGSYLDDEKLEALEKRLLRVGEKIRLGKDEGPGRTALCTLVRDTAGDDR